MTAALNRYNLLATVAGGIAYAAHKAAEYCPKPATVLSPTFWQKWVSGVPTPAAPTTLQNVCTAILPPLRAAAPLATILGTVYAAKGIHASAKYLINRPAQPAPKKSLWDRVTPYAGIAAGVVTGNRPSRQFSSQ